MMTPRDWFCFVGEDGTRVWSSATNTYVAADDPAFAAKKGPDCPGKIVNEAELWELMQTADPGYLPLWLFDGTTFTQTAVDVYSKAQLSGYAAEVRRTKLQGDIVINGLPFSTDPLTLGSLNSAYIFTQAKTGEVFSWKLPDGSFITLNKADIAALHDAANAFAQACFACEDQALGAISAGSTTTLQQIDAAFAAINNSFTGLIADPASVRHKRKK